MCRLLFLNHGNKCSQVWYMLAVLLNDILRKGSIIGIRMSYNEGLFEQLHLKTYHYEPSRV